MHDIVLVCLLMMVRDCYSCKNRHNLLYSSCCSTGSSSLRSLSPSLRYSHQDFVTRIIKTSLSLLQTLLGVYMSIGTYSGKKRVYAIYPLTSIRFWSNMVSCRYIICIGICHKVVKMHYKFTFKTIIYRIGVPQLPREGVPQWNNSVKETNFF